MTIGFNSQRDGILLIQTEIISIPLKVSIPNGMEFYYEPKQIRKAIGDVSIPNGIEFYLT